MKHSKANRPRLALGLLNYILSQEYLFCPAVLSRPCSRDPANHQPSWGLPSILSWYPGQSHYHQLKRRPGPCLSSPHPPRGLCLLLFPSPSHGLVLRLLERGQLGVHAGAVGAEST